MKWFTQRRGRKEGRLSRPLIVFFFSVGYLCVSLYVHLGIIQRNQTHKEQEEDWFGYLILEVTWKINQLNRAVEEKKKSLKESVKDHSSGLNNTFYWEVAHYGGRTQEVGRRKCLLIISHQSIHRWVGHLIGITTRRVGGTPSIDKFTQIHYH